MGQSWAFPEQVRVVEVGPRDGLQNEAVAVPTQAKLEFVNLLSQAGFPMIEASSFVRPDAVPQVADADALFTALPRAGATVYSALVPTVRGLERALAVGVRHIAVFTAATDTFSQRNVNRTIAESLNDLANVVRLAREADLWVRAYISVCFGCPYEGTVAPTRVVEVAERLMELQVNELCLADTIGVATPLQVSELVGLVGQCVPSDRLALHLHDTRGTALANTLVALQAGVTCFDSSAGGLGGCPFAPGAAGNLASEDLIYMLDGMGVATGVSLDKLVEASRFIARYLDHPLTSKYLQAVGGDWATTRA